MPRSAGNAKAPPFRAGDFLLGVAREIRTHAGGEERGNGVADDRGVGRRGLLLLGLDVRGVADHGAGLALESAGAERLFSAVSHGMDLSLMMTRWYNETSRLAVATQQKNN